MKKGNICKFPSISPSDGLRISCFVLETDTQNMQRGILLKDCRILLVVNGEGRFHFDRQDLPFRVGTLVFGFENEQFSVESNNDARYIYMDFNGIRADELLRRFDIRKSNRLFDGLDGLIPLWSESLSRASAQTIDLASESILLYTFSRLFGNLENRNLLIDQIIEITEERFNDPDLSISALAEALCYNAKYLSHAFKEKMQMTYSEYLRSLRIKYAISLFDHGLDSIKNIALLSGFTDPLYFSNVFKKSIGISPKAYISNMQKR